jgi:hypothetical protein
MERNQEKYYRWLSEKPLSENPTESKIGSEMTMWVDMFEYVWWSVICAKKKVSLCTNYEFILFMSLKQMGDISDIWISYGFHIKKALVNSQVFRAPSLPSPAGLTG